MKFINQNAELLTVKTAHTFTTRPLSVNGIIILRSAAIIFAISGF
jgi:hypothetical protein